jgi:protein gp37
MSKRLAGRCGYPEAPHNFDVTLHPDRLDDPLRWRKPRRVFVCSMGDLFHKDIPDSFILEVFRVMGRQNTRQHTFQVLTKRPERMKAWINEYVVDRDGKPDPFPNIWLGVTAENQEQADKRIPILRQIPAAVRFVSVEPMLGAIDFESKGWLFPIMGHPDGVTLSRAVRPSLDWVICGGETGPGARPMYPEWARSLRDQCQDAGVAFFFKKWGGVNGHGWVIDGKLYRDNLLDGREWDEMPERE